MAINIDKFVGQQLNRSTFQFFVNQRSINEKKIANSYVYQKKQCIFTHNLIIKQMNRMRHRSFFEYKKCSQSSVFQLYCDSVLK